jgi:hypothetical protein
LPQGILAVAIPCGRGNRVIAPTLRLTSVQRCAGLTVRWRSGVPAHRVHRARLGAALRGLAPLPPGAQPLPCCNTPCCNAAHPVATFCAILQHSARSCNILRVRAFVGYACAHPAAQHATCCAAHDMGRRGASHPLYVPAWDTAPHGIPCRMGYRAAVGYRAAWGVGRPMWRRCETRGGAVSFAARRRACCAWRRGSPAHQHAHQPRHTPSSRCLPLSRSPAQPLSCLAPVPLSPLSRLARSPA